MRRYLILFTRTPKPDGTFAQPDSYETDNEAHFAAIAERDLRREDVIKFDLVTGVVTTYAPR